jgi:hypothetical protein
MHYQFHPNCTEHALATGETRTASLGGTCSEEFLDHVQTSMVPENEKPKINGKKHVDLHGSGKDCPGYRHPYKLKQYNDI